MLAPPALNSQTSTRSPQFTSAFNFGPGHDGNRTVGELVAELLKHWPGRWEDRRGPLAAHEAGLLQFAIDKAQALLHWSPVWSFATAVEQTVSWYRETDGAPQKASELTVQQIQRYQADARAAGLPWAG